MPILWTAVIQSDPGLDKGPMTHKAMDGVLDAPEVFVEGIPGLVFAGYQGMFAVITPALMTGCFAERMRFGPYLVFSTVWLILVTERAWSARTGTTSVSGSRKHAN